MEELIAAKEWARGGVMRDPQGYAWHVSKSGNVLPVIVKVRGELRRLGDNPRPTFSITGEVYNPRSRRCGGDGLIMGGCIHELAVHYFPAVAPLVRVHLADDNGVPMHAADNAAYFAGHSGNKGRDVSTLARHLRVTVDKASEMAQWVDNFYGDSPSAFDAVTTAKGAWQTAIGEFDLPAEWEREAAAALALLNFVGVKA